MKLFRPESSATISTFLEDSIIGKVAKECAINRQFPLETATLMALSVASHATGIKYCVTYPDGEKLPVGLYAIGEQPPGTSKSSAMNYFLGGLYDGLNEVNKLRLENRKQVLKSEADKKGVLDPFEEQIIETNFNVQAPVSDTTPEALDSMLRTQGGFFIANSTEQGLVNALVGGMYSDKGSNFDVLLKGFNAEWHSSIRVTREGFSGKPHGGVLCISQDGTIETILRNSNSTGLCERFMMISEGNMFSNRNHSAMGTAGTKSKEVFARTTKALASHLGHGQTAKSLMVDDLVPLKMSKEAWGLVVEQKQGIEDLLADDEKYGAMMFRGMWSKIDIQIMKTAATMHVYSGNDESTSISLETTKYAAAVVTSILRGVVKICEAKGFIGKSAEVETIEDYMGKNAIGINGKTMRQIKDALRKRETFKQHGANYGKKIEEAVDSMVDSGVLMKIVTGNKRETYRYVG